jgi:hypothetical protein
MFPKFDAIPVRSRFIANGTLYLKTGAFTYVEVLNESMGEQTISPFIEARIIVDAKKIEAETQAAKEIEVGLGDRDGERNV